MSKLNRIKNKIKQMRVTVEALELETKAAKAAMAVSAEALERLRTKIEHKESTIEGLRNEIARKEEKIQTAKAELDKLKSRS